MFLFAFFLHYYIKHPFCSSIGLEVEMAYNKYQNKLFLEKVAMAIT